MLPVFAFQNANHCSSGDSVQLGKSSHCHAGYRKLGAPSHDLLLCKESGRVFFAGLAVARGWPSSLFFVAVQYIVSVASQPEVSRVNTEPVGDVSWWVVCVARVADQRPIWDCSIMQRIGDTRRFFWMRIRACADLQLAVSVSILCAGPRPAIIWAALVNLFPEAISDGTQGSDLIVVTDDKSNRLPLDVTKLGVVSLCNRGRLTTAAFTEFYRRFVRGMIVHVVSPFLTTGHSVGLFAQSPRFFIA